MIRLSFKNTADDLFGKSKWWGFPDMPEDLDYPEVPVNEDGEAYDEPLTFICQIRCEDIGPYDPEGLLPHSGMLYFFGAMDYFLGNYDALLSPGLGEWSSRYFKVLYAPSCEGLHTHSIVYDDGTPACLPAREILFNADTESESRLLGEPFFEEVRGEMPGLLSLLQVDEDDDSDLRFFDCGMLNFLISPEDLQARRFSRVRCYLHSL